MSISEVTDRKGGNPFFLCLGLVNISNFLQGHPAIRHFGLQRSGFQGNSQTGRDQAWAVATCLRQRSFGQHASEIERIKTRISKMNIELFKASTLECFELMGMRSGLAGIRNLYKSSA